MFNQSISIVEFSQLYNILNEIKNLFKFNINNFEETNSFINKIKSRNVECLNSIIIVNNKNNKLFYHSEIDKNAILVFDEFPFKINVFKEKVNIQLIKQKYNFQSKLNIKNYILNFNSRIISSQSGDLKLTEREIDIILFLKESTKPQSVNELQRKVWGYTFNLETHTVETHIYRLRKKIKDKFNDEKFILSHNEGYAI